MMNVLRSVVFASVMGVAACARPDPPLLTLSGRTCDATPVLTNATAVPFDARTGATVMLGATSPCLVAGDGRTVTYAVFRLPDAPAPYQVTIGSEVMGNAVVSPRATVYDAAGAPVRVLTPGDFRAGVNGFTAGLRTRDGDRLILVAADPATVGEPTTLRLGRRETGVQVASTVIVPIVIPVLVNDQVRRHQVTFSLNGTVRVTAAPILTVP